MPRVYGYSLKGKRCFGRHNWQAKGRINAIGALLGKSLLTVSLFECTINSEVFGAWMTDDLLTKLPPASVIVLDNASFHKNVELLNVISSFGHTIQFLPVYSPDLNLIEHKWAQAKSIRRTNNCSVDELFSCYLL